MTTFRDGSLGMGVKKKKALQWCIQIIFNFYNNWAHTSSMLQLISQKEKKNLMWFILRHPTCINLSSHKKTPASECFKNISMLNVKVRYATDSTFLKPFFLAIFKIVMKLWCNCRHLYKPYSFHSTSVISQMKEKALLKQPKSWLLPGCPHLPTAQLSLIS